MYLTTIVNIKQKSPKHNLLKELTHSSKNLYNKTLFTVRQHFFETGKFLKFSDAYHVVKDSWNQEGTHKEYYRLTTNASQQTMKAVESGFKSFFELLKIKKPGEKVRISRYLPENSHYKVVFVKDNWKIIDGYIRVALPKYIKSDKSREDFMYFKQPKNVDNLVEVHILPDMKGRRFKIAFIHKKDEIVKRRINQKYLAIDLGVNNFASMINSVNGESILIDGKEIKSINQFYNKKKAELQSINKVLHDKDYSKQLGYLDRNRSNKMKDRLHKMAEYIVNYCVSYNIDNIIIGHNIAWKDSCKIGKKNTQNFVMLPHSKLIEYIKYKAKLKGILVETTEESYTSKCDGLALEELGKQTKYLGRRVKRGLFKSSLGVVLNADVNGAINILRKVLSKSKQESFIRRILSSGLVFRPVKIKIVA